MWSRKIDDLIPDMQPKVWVWINKCRDKGHDVVVTCTKRNQSVQDALYAQGREPLAVVNTMRRYCGLWKISEAENKIITWTRASMHVEGKALDFAIRGKDHVLTWNPKVDIDDDKIPDYEECGVLAESVGLKWGGRFTNSDRPHIEYDEIFRPQCQSNRTVP